MGFSRADWVRVTVSSIKVSLNNLFKWGTCAVCSSMVKELLAALPSTWNGPIKNLSWMDLLALKLNSGEMPPPKRFQVKDCDSWRYILANQLAIPSLYREEIRQMADVNLTSIWAASQALWAERAVDHQCLARWQRYSHSWRLRAICCKAGSCALCRQEFHDRTLPHKSTQKWYTCNFPKPSGFQWVRQKIRKRHQGVNALLFCLAQASQWELSFSSFPACSDLLSYQALLAACSFLVITLAASGLDYRSFPHLSTAFYIRHKAPWFAFSAFLLSTQ